MPQINPAPLAGADPVRAPPRRDSVRQSVRQSVTQSIHQASLNLVDDEAVELLTNAGKERNETPSIPLSDEPIHNLTHISWTNFYGVVTAVPVMGLIYLSNKFADWVSGTLLVSRPYLLTTMGMLCFEIFACIVFGSKSKAYRDRHFYCQWPIWCLLATATITLTVFTNDGDMGHFAIPLSLMSYSISHFLTRYYQICKGEEVEVTALTKLRVSMLRGFVMYFANFAPVFGQLIPVNMLAENYPLTNMAVTGFGLPAFTFACKKSSLAFVMAGLERKVKDGELPVSQLLPVYATWSQIISVCMTHASITVMFYSEQRRLCAYAAGMAVLTEVGGRAFTVYTTWKTIHEISAVRAKAEGVTAMDTLNSMTAVPGVNFAIDNNREKDQRARIVELEVTVRGLECRLEGLTPGSDTAARSIILKQTVRIEELEAIVRGFNNRLEGLTQGRESAAQSLVQNLTAKIKELEGVVRGLESRLGEEEVTPGSGKKQRDRNEELEGVVRGLESRLGKYEQVTSALSLGDDRAITTDTNQSSLQPPSHLIRVASPERLEVKDEEKGEEEESEVDAKLRIAEKNWENVLILLGARWNAEIPAEKACIIVAGFVNWYFRLDCQVR